MASPDRPRVASPAVTERGSALPIVAVLLVVMGAFLLALGRAGEAMVEQARADSVADSVALAAAGGGSQVARQVAEANQASLRSVQDHADGPVVVEIAYRSRVSVAAAMSGARS